MKIALLALAAALAAASAMPASAAPTVAAGTKVIGPQGNPVGTVVSVDNGQAVIDTGKHQVALPLDRFGEAETGATITVTKEQLDGMVDAQLAEITAKRDAALVAGAAVATSDGASLGTVLEVDGDNVVIARGGDESKKVTLLREHLDAGTTGLTARLSMAQIEAALASQAGG